MEKRYSLLLIPMDFCIPKEDKFNCTQFSLLILFASSSHIALLHSCTSFVHFFLCLGRKKCRANVREKFISFLRRIFFFLFCMCVEKFVLIFRIVSFWGIKIIVCFLFFFFELGCPIELFWGLMILELVIE